MKFKFGDKVETIYGAGEIVGATCLCGQFVYNVEFYDNSCYECHENGMDLIESNDEIPIESSMTSQLAAKAVELARLELNISLFHNTEFMAQWDDWAALAVRYIETLSEEEIDRNIRIAKFINELLDPSFEIKEETKEESLISSALDKELLSNNNYCNNNFELDKNKS